MSALDPRLIEHTKLTTNKSQLQHYNDPVDFKLFDGHLRHHPNKKGFFTKKEAEGFQIRPKTPVSRYDLLMKSLHKTGGEETRHVQKQMNKTVVNPEKMVEAKALINPQQYLAAQNQDKAIKIDQDNNIRFNEELKGNIVKRNKSNFAKGEGQAIKNKEDLDLLSKYSHNDYNHPK